MTEQCPNPGTFKFTWPGRNEAHICAECLPTLQKIVCAIGFYVQIRPVSEHEQWQCEQQRETTAPTQKGESE